MLVTLSAAPEATNAIVHPAASVEASSSAGAKYTAAHGADGKDETRWASRDTPAMPQWMEIRYVGPTEVDYLYLHVAVDPLYSPWAEMTVTFSEGDAITHTMAADDAYVSLHFPARKTNFIRVTLDAVHEPRHYVGLFEAYGAYDPDRKLTLRASMDKPVAQADLVIRRRPVHPNVNLTPEDIVAARQRIEGESWAKDHRDAIVAKADTWLREEDAYWLAFLPEPGACYAYGFTACPICDGNTGKWQNALCSWDKPGQVRCANGHTLPDADHPDDGTGYVGDDGRIHYFVGQFNAWATEQWTQFALPALTQAYLLTGDERYAERAALFLDGMASIYKESTSGSWDYPSNPPSGRFARPWYQVARTLVRYVDFYDRLYNSPTMDQPSLRPDFSRRENIEENMLLDGAYYCYNHAFSGNLHNGHADYLRGALAVGCLLDIPEYIRIAVEGSSSIHAMLANNIDRDGRYYETSLGYGIHARELYLTFADPLYNVRNAEYPEGINLYDDPALRAAILLPDTQVMMAGRQPNFGDWAPDIRYLAPAPPKANESDLAFLERLYARTSSPTDRADYATLLRWNAGQSDEESAPMRGDLDWALWHARPLEADPAAPTTLPTPYDRRIEGSWVAGMKGMALLRAGDQAVFLRYGPSLNHGDPDDLGLLYYANGYELSYDLGYGLGSTHAHVGWASSTVSHAVVTVNETNQLEDEGSGGSLEWFADLPGVQALSASSPASYASEGVSTYRRSLALIDGVYLVDQFEVVGGQQHDFGFGSIGTDLQAFGTPTLLDLPGSLAVGVDWGRAVGADGDIKGYPNKPYWNPPPGNGYGFFKDVRQGGTPNPWGGTWTLPGDPGTHLKMHLVGDGKEAIVANAPGLYPNKPDASYLLARHTGEAPLSSTFLAVYEPFATEPVLKTVRRVGRNGIEVQQSDGTTHVILFGSQQVKSTLATIDFAGDFAQLRGSGDGVQSLSTLGSTHITVDGEALKMDPGVFQATVAAIDLATRRVTLDRDVPSSVAEGIMATFSNPAYNRTTGYHVSQGDGNQLVLEAGSLALGIGRVWEIRGPQTLLSDIPHEYARHVRRKASKFFDGKMLQGERGNTTRVLGVEPGTPMTITVEDTSVFTVGERFHYLDIAPGDDLRVALPFNWNRDQTP